MAENNDAPAATGASDEHSGENSTVEVNATSFPETTDDVIASTLDDDPLYEALDLTPWVPEVIHPSPGDGPDSETRLPDTFKFPRHIWVGERHVILQSHGLLLEGKDDETNQIANFLAFVGEHRVKDDGVSTVAEYGIRVYQFGQWFHVDVPAEDFSQVRWLSTDIGPSAIIYPRQREIVVATIQELSREIHHGVVPRTTVYGHLGWRQLPDGTRVFLNAGGGLGPVGNVPGVQVALPSALSHFYLDPTDVGDELRAAVRASLSILDLGPGTITVPVLGATYCAPLGDGDLTVHLAGYTGSFKSSLASLAQQHFGAALDVLHLASWSSTENALEAMAFVAKDCLLVVDDFIPQGSQNEVGAWHAKADRVIRAVANRSGRARLDGDSELKDTRPARCTLMSSGEDLPKGQSLRGRYLGIDMQPGDIDVPRLTIVQDAAATGVLARAMAGYIQWLARDWERWSSEHSERTSSLRTGLLDIQAHPFTTTIVAKLGAGFRTFLDFAVDIAAISKDQSDALWASSWQALREVLRQQQEGQREANPVDAFLRYLTSAISAGHAHVAGIYGKAPGNPEAWGWKKRPNRIIFGKGGVPMDREEGEWVPSGVLIGWLDLVDELYLDPTAAMGVAHAHAGRMGENLSVTEITLGKRLKERGLLTVEESRDGVKMRKMINGKRLPLWQLDAAVLGVGIRDGEDGPADREWRSPSGDGGSNSA